MGRDWRSLIGTAYDTWKAHFDISAAKMMKRAHDPALLDSQRMQVRNELGAYSTAYSAVYHAAHVVLASDFLDLQIYAGARQLLGRPVGRVDYTRSQRVVKNWANRNVATASKAAWHAAMIIRDATQSNDIDSGNIFIHPWCLYLATVTIWSFFHARPARSRQRSCDPDDEIDEVVWDTRADMDGLISKMTEGTPADLVANSTDIRGTCTAGLTAVISKRLSKVRWAIVHEGMLVLKGLVPWRLINEVEGSI